jgi:hypothetical protein
MGVTSGSRLAATVTSVKAAPASGVPLSIAICIVLAFACWALAFSSVPPSPATPPPPAVAGACPFHDAVRGAHYELSTLGPLSWTSNTVGYMFDACVNLPPIKGGFCQTQTAPALQRLPGSHHLQPCPRLGSVSARSVGALPDSAGLRVRYGGGEACGGYGKPDRNVTIDIVCADLAAPRVRGVEETSSCNYHARVEAREGCPRECARDAATGAVCGGAARGACAAAAVGGSGARCECVPPRAGPACELEASPDTRWMGLLGVNARALLVGILLLLVVLAGRATRRLHKRHALLACAALLALAIAPSHLFDSAISALRAVDGAVAGAAPPLKPAVSHMRVLFAAAGDTPLRRHAILLTGAIRDLIESFPTLLRLLRGTPGGFDVYAVLSPTKGGWQTADREVEEDEAALAWLRALPDTNPRVALQLLAFDTTPTLGPLTPELTALFPGFLTYDAKNMITPGINQLLDLKKMLNAWDFMQSRCNGSAGGGNGPPPPRAARGQRCYDMLVRARPDLRWQEKGGACGSCPPVFDEGLDLDRVWGSLGSGAAPFSEAVSWLSGSAVVGVSLTPPPPPEAPALSQSHGAACLHTDAIGLDQLRAAGGLYRYLTFFTPAWGNGFGGPSDMLMIGDFDALQLYFPRAPLVESLLATDAVSFHPEEMVRCGMVELLRQADYARRKNEPQSPMPILQHVILELHYCRHNTGSEITCF